MIVFSVTWLVSKQANQNPIERVCFKFASTNCLVEELLSSHCTTPAHSGGNRGQLFLDSGLKTRQPRRSQLHINDIPYLHIGTY